MGRKSIKNVNGKNPTVQARQELFSVVKSIDQYNPYLKDCILLGQHLWITSNRWLFNEKNMANMAPADLLKAVATLRQFHEDMLMFEVKLTGYRKQLMDYRKGIHSPQAAFMVMGEFIGDLMPKVNDLQLEIATRLAPMKEINDLFAADIATNVGQNIANGLANLLKDLDEHINTLSAQKADELSDAQVDQIVQGVIADSTILDQDLADEDIPDGEVAPLSNDGDDTSPVADTAADSVDTTAVESETQPSGMETTPASE